MISVIASIVVDRGFESRWGKAKKFEIGVCCFFAKHTAALRSLHFVKCSELKLEHLSHSYKHTIIPCTIVFHT
jgi:hypothetical protein